MTDDFVKNPPDWIKARVRRERILGWVLLTAIGLACTIGPCTLIKDLGIGKYGDTLNWDGNVSASKVAEPPGGYGSTLNWK